MGIFAPALTQALESYHRRTNPPTPKSIAARQQRLDRIEQALTADDWPWLRKRVRPSEPAAADRIRDLVQQLDAGWLLTATQVTLAADLRNYYTHFDPVVDTRLPTPASRFRIMNNLSARLRVLCELVLLDALRFSRTDVRKRFEETRRLERHLVREISEPEQVTE